MTMTVVFTRKPEKGTDKITMEFFFITPLIQVYKTRKYIRRGKHEIY